MADLSKIKLNGTEYDLKDNWIRENSRFFPKIYIEKYSGFEDNPEAEYVLCKSSLIDGVDNVEKYTLKELYAAVGVDSLSRLVWLETYDGDGSSCELYILSASFDHHNFNLRPVISQSYSYYLETNSWWSAMDDIAKIHYEKTIELPEAEWMANVESMLTSFGLNASANLAPAQTGTAEVGKAVVQ